jgi:type IV pilus assembly protein PilX
MNPLQYPASQNRDQRGVVLIIALIMLVVISLLATLSIRNATSSEAVSGNVRTTQLATQAAEIALRYCEDSVEQSVIAGGTPTIAISTYQAPARWTDMNEWDGAGTAKVLVPAASVNTNTATVTFNRVPECLVERLSIIGTKSFVITARGFGPEVANVAGRPKGSEIWLQSTLEFN